ncbi:MAG: NADP(H)-dependent aldo-keto reductase [Flavobacteriia bacterium]|nr:NADP(H)-dependent aldo-keto reductase [Flavobacteriia bacterium]
MDYTFLPHTDLKVSSICLGTMTFGNQNTQAEGFEQMDYALDRGVNFFDTAELYPVPANAQTQGETERIIGNWFQQSGKRDQVILASKVAGPGDYTKHIRENLSFSKAHINEAINNSLKRLKTDYIDLYQLHWPERNSNRFGQRGFVYDPNDPWVENFEAVLSALEENIKCGKIRHIGVSNETPWGMMRFLDAAGSNLPRMITIQNAYSLLCREFETGLSEICHRESVGLLAYSPLGFGVLTGKYLGGKLPEKARLTLFPRFSRYSSPQAAEATAYYLQLAEDHGLSLTALALAFVKSRSFVTSNIIGATNLEQLKENIDAYQYTLSEQVLQEIDKIHNQIPNPAV